MEYKKSYAGFWVWLLVMCNLTLGGAFLPDMGTQILVAIIDNVMTISIFVLTLMIYLNEKVYWYNGTSYEEAREAGSMRRKAFALAHMKRFGGFAAIFLLYSIVSILVGISYWIDIVVVTAGLVIAAISTMKIKL